MKHRGDGPKYVYKLRTTFARVTLPSGAGRWQRRTSRSDCHAAVSSQLRIPSLTPSHTISPCVFNKFQPRVIFNLELCAVDASLQTLAEGLTAEINAGLTRFSYLRVIAAGSSDKAARYVIDGGIRQPGSRLRVTVQLTDTITQAQLWVETYERTFDPDKIFDIPDPELFSEPAGHSILGSRRTWWST